MFIQRQLAQSLKRIVRRYYHPICGGDCSVEDDEFCGGKKGLVLGAYDDCETYELTKYGKDFDQSVGGKVTELLKNSGLELGKARVFNDLGEYYGVAIAGLGPKKAGVNDVENLDECKENIRIAAAVGAKALQHQTVENILIEEFTNAEAAAEGAILGLWRFQEFRNECERETRPKVALHEGGNKELWTQGVIKARAQNLARRLEDLPANVLTPKEFVKAALYYLCPCDVQVTVRDWRWIKKTGMNSFYNIAKGSCSCPYFLELSYCGGGDNDKPVTIVGKGVTFDSGGICLKKCETMHEYRGDCAGASVLVASMKAAAQMKLKVNLIGLIPLFENMPSGNALKPGDMVLSLDDKTIIVEDTDNEARLAMADALVYANKFSPCLVMSIATLTPGIRKCLGSGGSGAYTVDDGIWEELKIAGSETGDRFIRLPIWSHYARRNTMYEAADLHNVGFNGSHRGGDSAIAAAFLNEFVPEEADFLHMDITGTGMISSGKTTPYYRSGYMTGRPTRSIIQFLSQMSCPGEDKSSPCGN